MDYIVYCVWVEGKVSYISAGRRYGANKRARVLGGRVEILKELEGYGEGPGWVLYYLHKMGPAENNSLRQHKMARELWKAKARTHNNPQNLKHFESKLTRHIKVREPFSWGA